MGITDNLKAVLCDPNGKCCINGSEKDRQIVDEAIKKIEFINFELHCLIIDCLDYFEKRSDAEWLGEEVGMKPNEEMQMVSAIEATLRVCDLPFERG